MRAERQKWNSRVSKKKQKQRSHTSFKWNMAANTLMWVEPVSSGCRIKGMLAEAGFVLTHGPRLFMDENFRCSTWSKLLVCAWVCVFVFAWCPASCMAVYCSCAVSVMIVGGSSSGDSFQRVISLSLGWTANNRLSARREIPSVWECVLIGGGWSTWCARTSLGVWKERVCLCAKVTPVMF